MTLVSLEPFHTETGWNPASPMTWVVDNDYPGLNFTGDVRVELADGGHTEIVTDSVPIAGWDFTATLSMSNQRITCTLIPTGGWPANTLHDGTGPAYTIFRAIAWTDGGGGFYEEDPINQPEFTTGSGATSAYVETEVGDDAIDGYEANMPMFVSPNVAGDENEPPEWRESGSWTSGADATDSNAVIEWSTRRVYDRVADVVTRPATAETAWFLIFDLADVAFDVVAIIAHNFATSGVTEVAVEIANSNDFGVDFLELASWSSFSGARLVAVDMNGNQRYSGVQWLRIRVTGSGATAPEIGEVFLWTRHQLRHRADMSADNLSLASSVLRAQTEGGETQIVRRWSGRLSVALTWHPDTAAYLAIFRAWYTACRWGADPFLYIPFPETTPHAAYLCLTDTAGQVVNAEADHYTRTVALTEQPPFVIKES